MIKRNIWYDLLWKRWKLTIFLRVVRNTESLEARAMVVQRKRDVCIVLKEENDVALGLQTASIVVCSVAFVSSFVFISSCCSFHKAFISSTFLFNAALSSFSTISTVVLSLNPPLFASIRASLLRYPLKQGHVDQWFLMKG
jgi:hypothetical protein